MTIPFQELINGAVKEKREEKEIVSWHASRIGSCLRGIYFERIGEKPEKDFTDRELRVFHCGHIFEEWIVNLLKKQNDYKLETQVRVEDKELNVSGYADLVLSNGEGKKVYELKSKNSRAFWYMVDKKEGANIQHKKQLWIYLKVLGIDEGSIVYVEKDTLSIVEFPVFLNDKKLEEETMGEITLLNKAWKEKNPKLLPLIDDPKDWRYKFCRFHKKCLDIG